MRTTPIAVFMAFGTKGDVYPIAAIAAAFACEMEQYDVVFITHSAHESLKVHLESKGVAFFPVSSPPVFAPHNLAGSNEKSFSLLKRQITTDHRRECVSIVERVFGDDSSLESDLMVINFFALEGWSLAELFCIRCVVAAPYVVPYSAPSSFERKFKKEYPILYRYLCEAPADKVGWNDVIHWMWPLFTEEWGSWRSLELSLSPCPFTVSHCYRRNSLSYMNGNSKALLSSYAQISMPIFSFMSLAQQNLRDDLFNDQARWRHMIHIADPTYWEKGLLLLYVNGPKVSIWFQDPVTGLPVWHDRPSSPLLMYGFSKEVVECPGYWPSSVRVCGFWFLPCEWQFSCIRCAEISVLASSKLLNTTDEFCPAHIQLPSFLASVSPEKPIFISLSSIGSMGYMSNPKAFLQLLGRVINISSHQFLLFTAGYEPLDTTIKLFAEKELALSEQSQLSGDGVSLFGGRLFCFSGSIPYNWLFPRCAAVIHHGGSGSTAAALHSGTPQILCPFCLDQFYWAERMFWIGVAPEPLKRNHLIPDNDEDFHIKEAADAVVTAINSALSVEMRKRALDISEKISFEDGVSEAVRILKEELSG
ncbi:OLC1v1002494C1 [Oldenlandia corymbosa var. corymbosa]|uniref:OLC1v1002494C1 n=1 Tax=Oldenlandia corymbosa var. corymbosa TaxID=529605 RepID=A0AAV1DB61_OLDCO|nr:OLC1v1002494C1 [Oldenlandia corymbosa var. corymbosa]